MKPPRFTVLLPVIRPPALLPYAIESVLEQSERDFELCVICDGAPPETVSCARAYAARDRRVKVFPFAKGERNGEAHRHQVLSRATSRYVAQIADDDLWLPHHLDELSKLLAGADFGNLPQITVRPDSRLVPSLADLADPAVRRRMRTSRSNIFGPTVCGYRLKAYRKLESGWTPAPPDIWSDLHMWRKFLARDDLTFDTRFAVTALCFRANIRRDMSLDDRVLEHRRWLDRIRRPEEHAGLTLEVLKFARHKAAKDGSSFRIIEHMYKEQGGLLYWRTRIAIRRLRRRVLQLLRR